MNTLTDSDIPVLHLQVVYHLPKDLDGEFQAGQVKRGPERPVSKQAQWAGRMTEELFRQMWRAQGYPV